MEISEKMIIFTKENIKQFVSYFCVGGMSAIVEWLMFYIFSAMVHIEYLIATVLAFIFSTTVNWILGRAIAFKGNQKYAGKGIQEFVAVFGVSAMGLVLNMILMYLFVSIMYLNTPVLMTGAKIMATGIVFIWNFLARKLFIYQS